MVADFNKKAKLESFKENFLFQILGIVFVVIVIVLFLSDYRIYQRKRELAKQVESYKKQIEELEQSGKILKEQIANADNKDYLEKVAYEQLGQQKPGEREIIFVSQEQKQDIAKKQETPDDFWDFLANKFGWLAGLFGKK